MHGHIRERKEIPNYVSLLRAICENPGRKKKSPITRVAKNWQADSKTIRPKRQE